MSERHEAKTSWFARWREHRRVKAEQAFERDGERGRAGTRGSSSGSAYQHRAPAGGWFGSGGSGGGFGGDGGGCGGGDGGGGGC